MLEKKTISPNVIKTITYTLISFMIATVLTLLMNAVMNKVIKRAENDYYESYKAILSGYEKSISISLESYKNVLEIFNFDKFLPQASEKDIAVYLTECTEKLPSDFATLLYINLRGHAYTNLGDTLDFLDENFYFKDYIDNRTYFVGNVLYYNQNDKEQMFFPVCVPVKNPGGKVKGTLCAIIPLSVLQNIFEENVIEAEAKFSIQVGDSFLYSKDSETAYKIPDDYILDLFNTSSILRLQERKINKNEYDVFAKVIPNTNWILSAYAPTQTRIELKKEKNRIKFTFVVVIVFLVFILSFIEAYVQNKLQQKQLIATLYDPLTGVRSRQHFEVEADKILKRHLSSYFMIVDCDIRGFKFINQKYGEKAADELLVFLAKILKDECDSHKGIIGRGYADHFTMLFKIDSVEEALKELEEHIPFINEKAKNSEISFFPLVGVAFHQGFHSGKETIQNLLGQASFAKNSIKNNLLDTYAVYDSKLVEKVKEEIFFEENMEKALENNEFFVMYQPKIDLTTEKMSGAEALVRWNNPILGFIGPDKFIPIFEKNGFIRKLDFFVYEQVFKFLQHCIDNQLPLVKISLNMSRKHNKPEQFMQEFLELFHKYTIPPEYIEIEILERSVMDSMNLTDFVQMLHDEGFTVAMDDFGSGESSLNMLSKIPIDVLKFDKDFLSGGKLDESTKTFITTLVNLGRNLQKKTVFEGVETKAQSDFLKSIKCDSVQGFFYSRPLFELDFINFIQRGK